ncbi:helix-turn-helix transcriptional regulator [Oceanisphaera sp. W20_SRM_FM3]|uniref:helix-turn-helix transcriptional regulator n=1 Tax=Oceanisphaera sp. W20_SRM_FM3 TaxID=3240267 RepID=UPI003F9707C3
MSSTHLKHLKIIDFHLAFFGRLQRVDLMTHCEISVATTSRALSEYRERFPDRVNYDASMKTYFAADDFKPAFAHQAQEALNFIAHGKIERFIGEAAEADLSRLPTLSASLSVPLVRHITMALALNRPITFDYYSASSQRAQRLVQPLAIFETAKAWYFRGYDFNKEQFRIFRFSRVLSVSQTRTAQAEEVQSKIQRAVPIDSDWQEQVIVTLMPHPKHPNPAALKLDLGLVDKRVCNLRVRKALVGFLLSSLRVDASANATLSPLEHQLYLANRHELVDLDSMVLAPGFGAQ